MYGMLYTHTKSACFVYLLNHHRPESPMTCTSYTKVNRSLPLKGLQTRKQARKTIKAPQKHILWIQKSEINASSIPGSRRSLGEGHGNPFQHSYWENSVDRGRWELQFMWSQRVRHVRVTNTFPFILTLRILQ